eukprot:NODE_2658_length_456_cov_410.656020_g2201_i0.p1 GENE.NODE_2658_length_456_cov_410.656020_g2201_i0~~NODE_2658_length_456_cov_410.656020_g2201_i0.p1  ORF type:complete len:122 (+),score=20.57 NODE_2658_length_456_cov_410.656020_g2201_i0:23-367(+)
MGELIALSDWFCVPCRPRCCATLPHVSSPLQVYIVGMSCCVIGLVFGLIFGLADIEDKTSERNLSLLWKELMWTSILGAVSGGILGAVNYRLEVSAAQVNDPLTDEDDDEEDLL